MANFYPPIEKIRTFKVQPEIGEWALLNFLEQTLDDSYEVYFNPYMNGDRPDVVVMRKGGGVLIIEVKDWNLDAYELNEKRQWKEKKGRNIVKSPISQVLKYKDNLFNLHIDKLLPLKITNIKNFNIVTCAVYFHNANRAAISAKLVNPYIDDRKYMDFLKYNIDLLGYDNLNAETFNKLLYNRWISRPSIYFTDEIYENIREFMQPTIHMLNDGVYIKYTDKQRNIIHSTTKEQRIKGVMGSGKTTVLAARAVYGYKRALETNPNAKVLILTFNITLKNFIHDKINRVREEFPWNVFVINNYHQFIKSEFNNLGIENDTSNDDGVCEVDMNPFDDPSIFDNVKDKVSKYDVILIDEIQDYKRVWMDIIKNNFLAENGEYVLFGDVKQNIYGNITENKDVSTNVASRPAELKICYRSDFKVKDLAIEFQKSIFKDKYEVDDFNKKGDMLSLEFEKEGYLNYMYLDNVDTVASIYAIVTGNVRNKKEQIARNDITVLGYNINDLQRFDTYYRYLTNEKTTTMFATQEYVYLHTLNYLKPENKSWIFTLLKDKRSDENTNKNIVRLFVVYDLYSISNEKFEIILQRLCNNIGIEFDFFINWISQYKNEYQMFKNEVKNIDRKVLDRNKKLHFWMNSGCIKISTIHSFKGWESKVVFLILDKVSDGKSTFDELLYTGITRCCSNLIVLNYGNNEYDAKIRPLIEKVKG